MSDLQLTDPDPTEEAALRVLLHRAVDDLEIPPYGAAPHGVVELDRHRSRRTPWLAAAAVLVVVAGGLAWWSSSHGDERIDAGPAEQLDPRVVEESGIWRLPAEGSSFEVAEVMESGVRLPIQIAVDDVEDPTKLLAISPAGFGVTVDPEAGPAVEFTDSTTYSLLHGPIAEDPTWLEVTGEGQTGYLTFAYVGLTDAEVMDAARSLVLEIGDTVGALTDTDQLSRALSTFRPPSGLTALWDPDGVAASIRDMSATGAPTSTIGLVAMPTADGDVVGISLTETGLPLPVSSLWRRVQSTSPARLDLAAGVETQERPDLGRGVSTTTFAGTTSVVVTTEDGVEISVATMRLDDTGATGMSPTSLSEQEQMGIINSLRSMSESDFRAALDQRGVPVTGPGDPGGPVLGGRATPDPTAAPTTTMLSSGG